MNTKIKKIHFIGICGVAMSAVATALWQKGWKVTGSDAGFFPPVSTHLKNIGIPYYSGWHPEKMIEGGMPNLVVVGNAIGSTNSEFVYVKENKIPFISYPQALGEFFIKPNSIVCAGTWGKTTSSALLSHILKHAKMHPSYMIGGLTQDDAPAAVIDSGDWSVVEGDEYKTSKWDQQAKFFHYKPTHLLLTAVSWDHADMYPTEKSYFEAFEKLVKMIPADGKIIFCGDKSSGVRRVFERVSRSVADKRENTPHAGAISYGKSPDVIYRYENIKQSADGISFDIDYHGKKYEIKSPLLGTYNAENITGCFAMAKEIGIAPGDITDAIKTFKGMKRRMEKRYENKVTVIDDIAHSPEKAKSVLKNLRSIYKGKIIAVYEPNSGNRTYESIPLYEKSFADADEVIIPRLTKLKVDEENPQKTFEGDELAKIISKTQKNVRYIDSDEKLVREITENRKDGDCVAFLGSHGFRGMIEDTIKKLAAA
jgi:UDP-N-acetylmuramate: L-alanyl-gamma-D-glutamyl-meso-diaminopimelate ligase